VSKNFLLATVIGAVVYFVLGYVIYELLLGSFYAGQQGSATGVMRDAPLWSWMILSILVFSAVIALILGWAGAKDAASGFKIAALVGLLVSISFDFGQYAMSNLMTMTGTLVDPIVGAIHTGIGGAVIGLMLGRDSQA